MKITRILPKPLAITWQECDLDKTEIYFKYYTMMAQNFEHRYYEGKQELERLRSEKKWK